MRRSQRGFTFVEVLVAMVITSIMVGAFGGALYHFLIVPALQGDHLTAINEVRLALDVIQADAVQAQSFTASEAPEYGYFSWDYYDQGTGSVVAHTVTYRYDEDRERLVREQSIDGDVASIASDIANVGDMAFAANDAGNAVTVSLTVTMDSGWGQVVTHTGTRTIEMRLAP